MRSFQANQRRLIVPLQAAGQRVDVYLAQTFPSWSRTRIARALREGRVRSSRRTLRPASRLQEGEELALEDPQFAAQGPAPDCPPLLHECGRFLAFNKPAGLLAHPIGRRFTWGLINLAREAYPEEELHLGHRLDRQTSGVMLLARGGRSNRWIKRAFQAREVRKTYWAIARGVIPWEEQLCEAPIGPDSGSPIRIRQRVQPGGAPAVTAFRVLARMEGLTLVSCRPYTGRTHQIRVHLESLGYPILGDVLYGQPPEVFLSIFEEDPLPDLPERLKHPRHCLHARALDFQRGPGLERIQIRAPLPDDFAWLMGQHGLLLPPAGRVSAGQASSTASSDAPRPSPSLSGDPPCG